MAQVFISYSRRDLPFIEQLVSDLKKTGIDVWYDLSGLEGGARWRVEIQRAIQNSDYVIVVLSPHSVESEWVEREYLFANNLKKKILPIMCRKCELPLTFLTVNYVDAQGENYSRNFDKITRFLNTEQLSPVSTAGPSRRMRTGTTFFAVFGVVIVLGAAATIFLSTARGQNKSPTLSSTTAPVQPAIQATSTSDLSTNPVMVTSTPVQPEATSTKQLLTPAPMVLPGLTQAEGAGQSAFVHVAGSENNMTGNWTIIHDPLASDPNALVFAMPNYNPFTRLGQHQVYNNHLIAVFYVSSRWTVINLDMGVMPQNAAFNIQILQPDTNAFVHMTTSSNILENATAIDNGRADDPNALVFATPNCSPPGGVTQCYNYNHPIGVWYTGGHWAIFNQDRAPMQEGLAFNVLVLSKAMNAFVHTATSANTGDNSTTIEDPLAGNPKALVFAMPRSSPEDNAVYNNHPVGVWFGEKWTVFNEDLAAMPEGAEFNILILEPK